MPEAASSTGHPANLDDPCALPCHTLCPAATYTKGQRIRLGYNINMNHGGRIAFRVCPLSRDGAATPLSCFNQPQHHLTRSV